MSEKGRRTISDLFLGNHRGDTLVEVLIATAIAAFTIGLSYATAQRSLQQSITAREHNEALNIMENQIADLKIRFQKTTDPAAFSTGFSSKHHFCLDDSGSDPSTASTWDAYDNNGPNGPPSENAALAVKTNSGPYDPKCQHGTDVLYFADIDTSPSSATVDTTLYHITVRWEKIGGGPINQASLDYKLNGSNIASIGAGSASGNILSGGNANYGPPPITTPPITTPYYSYGATFINKSINPNSSVTGCVWNWGDGSTTTNTACLNGDSISHTFIYLPWSSYKSPDPGGYLGLKCRKTFTVTLTITFNNGSPSATYSNTRIRPNGTLVNSLPLCSTP